MVDFQTIELDSDYSGQHSSIYLATYEGQSHVDAMGNVCITLRPTISGIILQSPDSNRWRIYATNDGESVTETVTTGTPDPVHLYDEDGIIVQLLIDNDGNLYTEKPPVTPGLVFEELYLASENGLAWKLHVLGAADSETEGVIQLRDAVGNKWKLLNQIGEVIHQVSQTAIGAIIDTQYISENDLEAPNEENGTITWALVQRQSGPAFALWNTFTNEWELTGGRATGTVGDIAMSTLDLATFQSLRDDTWVLADGETYLNSDWFKITGLPNVPDFRGLYPRGKNEGRTDSFSNPEGEVPLAGVQPDEHREHTHAFRVSFETGGSRDGWGSNYGPVGDGTATGTLNPYPSNNTSFKSLGTSTANPVRTSYGGAETRPKTITVNFYIKINA